MDTSSPVTVLNAQAAKQAGIATVSPSVAEQSRGGLKNPFTAIKGRLEKAQAAARGDVLSIFGVGGKQVDLVKSAEPVVLRMPVTADDDNNENESTDSVNFGAGHIYVGDLPGLAALQGIGVDAPPAVVLGMDVLRRKPRMLF